MRSATLANKKILDSFTDLLRVLNEADASALYPADAMVAMAPPVL